MKRGFVTLINGKTSPIKSAIPSYLIMENVSKLIKQKYSSWDSKSYISRDELKSFRRTYIESLIKKEKGEVGKIDKEVLQSLLAHESTVKKIMSKKENPTFGQRMADKVAGFAGSWFFIIFFFIIIIAWVSFNAFNLFFHAVDPFPFILLNLVLSCVAAIQAPIIIMSQNRKETKDRKRQEDDYKINLRAELEIRLLQEKIDHLIESQWERLLEIQELELESMDEK